jgi:hypothetical protein
MFDSERYPISVINYRKRILIFWVRGSVLSPRVSPGFASTRSFQKKQCANHRENPGAQGQQEEHPIKRTVVVMGRGVRDVVVEEVAIGQ